MAQYRGIYRTNGNPGNSNGFEDSLDHFSRQGSGSIPQRQKSLQGYEVPPPGPDIIENEILRQSSRKSSGKNIKCTRNSNCQCPNCKAAMSSLYASPVPPAPQRPDLMEETDHIRFGARSNKERGGSASRAGLALLKSKMNKHPSFRDEEYNSLPPAQYNMPPQQQRITQSQRNYQRQSAEVNYEDEDDNGYPQYQKPKQISNRPQPRINNRMYQSNSSDYNNEDDGGYEPTYPTSPITSPSNNKNYNNNNNNKFRQQPQLQSHRQPHQQQQQQRYQPAPQPQQPPPQQQQRRQPQPQIMQQPQQRRNNGPRVECTRKAGCQCPDCLNAMGALAQPISSYAPIEDPTANMILQPCPICGRNFSDDVLPKHIQACQKASKKRKTFNSTNLRVKAVVEMNGQDAAQIVKAALKKKEVKKKKPTMPKWKIQSEQFRAAMRSTKGGNSNGNNSGGGYDASKYEAPPDIDDRVPCPYCGRKFEAQVAERHIPKCKDIIAKPKTTHRNAGVGAYAAAGRVTSKKPAVSTRRR